MGATSPPFALGEEVCMTTGKAYLVGAGPGDIGLITVKGLEAIQRAEVILYDRLANPKLLDFAPPNCEFIYCGKLPDRHTLRQEKINELLVEKTAAGKIVVRLKGGDPGVFGRVGEEAEALAQNGLSFELIPGITSGIAAPLYAGIPVTHREYGESFAIVTAHDKSKDGKSTLNWEGLAKGIDTIAFYMGVGNLSHICTNLLSHGKPSSTPVTLIQWGTFGRQKTLEGTLETIVQRVEEEKFTNPAITLVGNIASLREKISWFEKKPLFGRQILLPRTGLNTSNLAKALEEQGADVIEFPKWKRVKITPDRLILSKLSMYSSIIFTSPESVEEFFQILIEEKIDIRCIQADLYGMSRKSVNQLLNKGLLAEPTENLRKGGTILLIGSSNNIEETSQNVLNFGNFDTFTTSIKEVDESYLPIFKRMLDDSKLNTVIFPSSASVPILIKAIEKTDSLTTDMLKELEIYCFGNQTMNALLAHDILGAEQTKEATISSLLLSLAKKSDS